MNKVSRNNAIKTTTMFLLSEEIENEFSQLVEEKVEEYQKAMIGIGTEDGLKKFIVNHPNSIEMLETVLGISGERMKRVVTMLRVNKGYMFETEWSEERLQKELVKDNLLLEEYCELFLKGRDLDKYKQLIPKFILDDFRIDNNVINRVTNADILGKLFKKKNDTTYTSRYASFYIRRVNEEIDKAVGKYGFSLENGDIDGIGKSLFYITDSHRYIIINYNYSLTTGQGQTKFQNSASEIFKNIRNKENMMMINVLDGAGWVGRSSDFKLAYENCHYYLNLNTIYQLSDITKDFFNLE